MAVTLSQSYAGYPSGQVVELPTNVENTLIAQRLATSALATAITTGAVRCDATAGVVGIAAGTSSLVITSALVNAQSKVFAVVAQAAADATLLRVERVVCADGAAPGLPGTITIFGTANATATTFIDWALIGPAGQTALI